MRAKRVIAAGTISVVVLAVGVAVGVFLLSSNAQGQDALLQPANEVGPHPFMPTVGTDVTIRSGTAQSGRYAGDSVGLYGGTRNVSSCNKVQMIRYLQANPAKAAAWAQVEGIPVNMVSGYIAGLTPVILRYDIYVVNHGFANGLPTAIPEVLQAGEAVLVDKNGVPRVRCYCGNPLTIAYTPIRHYVGHRWIDFRPRYVITVNNSPRVITNYTLIDVYTGDPFIRRSEWELVELQYPGLYGRSGAGIVPTSVNGVADGPVQENGSGQCMPSVCPGPQVPQQTTTT